MNPLKDVSPLKEVILEEIAGKIVEYNAGGKDLRPHEDKIDLWLEYLLLKLDKYCQ